MAQLQYWSSAAYGGYLTNNRLSRQMYHALEATMKFEQFCDIKPGWGRHQGDKLYVNKFSRISTEGGTLVETNTVPEHRFSIARGTISLYEYGNAVPLTEKLEDLSEFDVSKPTIRVLRDDAARVLDKAAGLQFKLTQRKYIGTSTAAGTLESRAAGNTLASGKNVKGGWRLVHLDDVVDELKVRQIPPFDGENYVMIACPRFLRQIRKDSDYKEYAKFGDPERLFSGEVGRISGVRIVEENHYLVNTIGSGGDYGEAVVFGAEAVAEGVAVPLEIRAKIPTDYGRSKGIMWRTIRGYQKFWKATDTDQDEHIIHMTGKS